MLRRPQKIICLIAVAIFGGCASPDLATAPMPDPTLYFSDLTVREKAVTLSLIPNLDTVQLHVAAKLGNGSILSERIRFTAGDSTISVDSTGLVTALFPTTNLSVVRIAVTYNGFTRRDSVQLRVLPTRPTVGMRTVSVSAPSGSSSTIPVMTRPTAEDPEGQLGYLQLDVIARDRENIAVPSDEIIFSIRSSDSTIAQVDQMGTVTARGIGKTTIHVVAVANAVYAEDSLTITVGPSEVAFFHMESPASGSAPFWRLGGETARIAVGGVVNWISYFPEKVSIVWDDTINIEAVEARPGSGFGDSGRGNILNLGAKEIDWMNTTIEEINDYLNNSMKARLFPVAGVYRFHGVFDNPTVQHSVKGVVIVCAPDAIQCE